MTYEQRRYGFDSLRIVHPGGAPAIFALGRSSVAVTGSLEALPGTLHHIVVELPQSAAQTDLIELHDARDINLVGAGTLVLQIRPWGATTQGSYTVAIHRQFRQGLIVRCANVATADFTVMYAAQQMTGGQYIHVS